MEREITQVSEIRKLQHLHEAEICARMMCGSEPWKTLNQTHDVSLEIVTDPSRETYLAVIDSEITGFVILHLQGEFRGYIQAVCVAPDWRDRGIGSQLMVFAEGRIFRETPDAFICVSTFNKGALRFYERRGYETVSALKDSEILLRKTSQENSKENDGGAGLGKTHPAESGDVRFCIEPLPIFV
jgi:ribosomal protein S18 acetylase RimI-like enzyme